MEKLWYEIYGIGPATGKSNLLVKVKSKGLAYIVAKCLSKYYKDVRVK